MEEKKGMRLQVLLPADSVSKLEDLAEALGAIDDKGNPNISYAVRATIAFAHSKKFPDYVAARNAIPRAPEDIAKARLAVEDAKAAASREKEEEEQRNLCLLMDNAEIVVDEQTGKNLCKYPVYTMNGPHTVEETWYSVALPMLNKETPSLQYHDVLGKTGPEAKKKVLRALNTKAKTKTQSV